MYSQVPNKRVYLINEYRIKITKILNEYELINEYTGKFHNFSKRVWPSYKRVELKFLNFRKNFVQNDWYLTLRPSKISAICTFNALNRYIKSQVLNKYHGNFKWFDLINEYERFFSKIVIEYGEKCPSMKEKGLDYLNEYTLLIGT